MRIITNQFSNSKYLLFALLITGIGFSFLRFVHINADFPSGITTSGTLYTDEGWYANSAIRDYLTGHWYLAGDINTAVTQPGGQVLYRLAFAVFGLSLTSARLTIIILFILLTLFLALWIRNYYGDFTALLSALLLSTNYFAFAYSRLALRYLIALFFIIASFFIIESFKDKSSILRIILASSLMAYAILTYTIAVFAIPLLLFLAWKNGRNARQRLLFPLLTVSIILILAGGYLLAVRNLYPVDVTNDTSIVSITFISHFSEWIRNIKNDVLSIFHNLGWDLVGLTAVLTLSALVVSRQFRSNTIALTLIGYSMIFIATLSINKYSPPRYYLMLLAPFAGLCAISCKSLMDWFYEHKWGRFTWLPLFLVLLTSLHGGWKIVGYLSDPQYSFYHMAQEVKNDIQEREGMTKGVILFGDIADSVSLETGTNAVNSGLWTSSHVAARLEEYRPKYLIVHTSHIDQVAISEGAQVTEIGRWDVFNNYYANGEQVRLYYLIWPGYELITGNP